MKYIRGCILSTLYIVSKETPIDSDSIVLFSISISLSKKGELIAIRLQNTHKRKKENANDS